MKNQAINTEDHRRSTFKSLISLSFIILTFFGLSFLQLEGRRQGYEVLKLNKTLKALIDRKRVLDIRRLNAMRPQKIEKEIQSRTALNQAGFHQIIHLPQTHSSIEIRHSNKRVSQLNGLSGVGDIKL